MTFDGWSWRRATIVGIAHAVVMLSCTALLRSDVLSNRLSQLLPLIVAPLASPGLCCTDTSSIGHPLAIVVLLANYRRERNQATFGCLFAVLTILLTIGVIIGMAWVIARSAAGPAW